MPWKPNYVDTADLRSFTRIGDNEDDTELDLAIAAASRAVDLHTNRQFGQVDSAEDRIYEARWHSSLDRWVVDIDDLMTESGLTVNADLDDDETFDDTIDEYRLRPLNAAEESKPWESIIVHPDSSNKPSERYNLVQVHATFGWTSIPDAVKKATLLQASRLHWRRFAPAGVAGSPETGSEVRLLAKLDPDVKVSLTQYVRWWGAV